MKGRKLIWLAGGIISTVGLMSAGRMIAIYNSTPPEPLPNLNTINIERAIRLDAASWADPPTTPASTTVMQQATPTPARHGHRHRSKAASPVIASGTCADVTKERMIPIFLDALLELHKIVSVHLPQNFHGQELPLMERLIETDEHRTRGMFPLRPQQPGQC
jgi:hypothetical protein